jgi:hypothetical protein
MIMRSNLTAQRGISLSGLIVILIIVAMIGVLAAKVVPTYTEFLSAKKAIASAKFNGGAPSDIRMSFEKQRDVGYVDAITGKDLIIVPNTSGGFEVGFAYDKKITLIGPVSLLIEYQASTTDKPLQQPTK